MCNHHKDNRQGSKLEDGQDHIQDHIQYSRRTFIQNLGMIGGASLLLGKIPVSALGINPVSSVLNNADSDRILVLIRLKGGNDGLNMIIPVYDYGNYRANRPTIAIPADNITMLDDAYGMPNYMNGAINQWNTGQMKVIHSVGYSNQSLSHFRSSDIWASASEANEVVTSGWLGRYLETEYPDFLNEPPQHPPAVQIGGTGNLVFSGTSDANLSMIVNDPQQLAQIASNGELYDANDVPACYQGEQLSYLRTVANSTFQYAEIISQTYDQGKNETEYTNNELGRQLAVVARLIKGGLQTRFFMVTLDGFDTHARQNDLHPYLMLTLSDAVEQFFKDLQKSDDDKRVLAMTFSEFGRRLEQNASNGTDHGASAPMLLFGKALQGNGFVGNGPSLTDLDPIGNLKYQLDFRQIYATLLESWLCIPAGEVDALMGKSFERLTTLNLSDCNQSTSSNYLTASTIKHWSQQEGTDILIHVDLPEAQNLKIQLVNLSGQVIYSKNQGRRMGGQHILRIPASEIQLSTGQYFYTLFSNNQTLSKAIHYFR